MLFIVGVVIYSIKIPYTQRIAFYPFLYMCIFLFIIFQQSIVSNAKVIHHSANCWIAIFLWGVLLSFANGFTQENFTTLMWCLSFVTMPVVFLYYSMGDKRYRFFRFAILLACLPIGLLGVYEALTGHYVHETHVSYSYFKNFMGYYRPNTIFYNVNDNAVFCLISLILSYFVEGTDTFKKWIRIMCLAVFGFNIIMVDSRGAELGLVVFLCVFYSRTMKAYWKAGALMLFPVVLFLGFVYWDYESFFEFGSRTPVWNISLSNLRNTGYLGVGPGMIATINERVFAYADIYAVHNFILELFCDFGIFGLVALLWWYGNLIKVTLAVRTVDPEKSALLFSALLAFLAVSITCSSLVGKSFPVLFFAIIIAECDLVRKRYQSSMAVDSKSQKNVLIC